MFEIKIKAYGKTQEEMIKSVKDALATLEEDKVSGCHIAETYPCVYHSCKISGGQMKIRVMPEK